MDINLKTIVASFAVQFCGGEALMPVELVAINGDKRLTLTARRSFDALSHNANDPGMATPDKRFIIARTAHISLDADNERLAQAIWSLMLTIITAPSPYRFELVSILGPAVIADRQNDNLNLIHKVNLVSIKVSC